MSMKNLIGNKNVSGTSLMGDDVKVSHKSVDVAYIKLSSVRKKMLQKVLSQK